MSLPTSVPCWLRPGAVLAPLILLVACVTAPSLQTVDQSEQPERAEQSGEPDRTPAGTLAGTSWRLVEIRSTDGSTYRPRETAAYTVAFRPDGSASIRADCNRGTGTWFSDGPWQLEFGVIATTRALCPPGSISERYLAQFQWVRSYVIEGGHLFLATRADGAIIEFEPIDGETGEQ